MRPDPRSLSMLATQSPTGGELIGMIYSSPQAWLLPLPSVGVGRELLSTGPVQGGFSQSKFAFLSLVAVGPTAVGH